MTDWVDSLTWHASAGDLFATRAMCGAIPDDEVDGILRLHSEGVHVTCVACRNLLLEATR